MNTTRRDAGPAGNWPHVEIFSVGPFLSRNATESTPTDILESQHATPIRKEARVEYEHMKNTNTGLGGVRKFEDTTLTVSRRITRYPDGREEVEETATQKAVFDSYASAKTDKQYVDGTRTFLALQNGAVPVKDVRSDGRGASLLRALSNMFLIKGPGDDR